jgi:hypothetical protein
MRNETNRDLRCAVRFPLRLPISLRSDPTAETHDISAGGLMFYGGVDYPIGSTIEFTICMPAKSVGADKDVHVECVGRVVRCAPSNGRVAVGAIIDEYHISR